MLRYFLFLCFAIFYFYASLFFIFYFISVINFTHLFEEVIIFIHDNIILLFFKNKIKIINHKFGKGKTSGEGDKTSGEGKGKSSGEGDETFLEQTFAEEIFVLTFFSARKRYVFISFVGLRHSGQVLAPLVYQFSKHFVPYS